MFPKLLLLLATATVLAADTATELDALLRRYHELGLFNGSVLVAQAGQPILRKGYGEANMEWHIPNAPDTRFRLGSISKQFTATLVMQLAEKGLIDLGAPIARYLPDYPPTTGDRITVRQLLNHTSGVPGYTELPEFGTIMREPRRPAEFISIFSKRELLFAPGTKYSYSNSGYFLLGLIVEKVGGKPYEQLLRERIFEPLGMAQSGYDSTQPLVEKRAAGYDATFDGYRNTTYLDMMQPYAAGSLFSSVDDLLRWDQALYGEKILSAASKQAMFTPGMSDYGYGWVIQKGAVTTIGHGGGINGFNTQITRDIETKRVYLLLNNTGGAPLGEMVDGMRAILDGKAAKMPLPPAAPVLYKTWKASGIAATMEQWKALQSAGTHDTRVVQLVRLAGGIGGQGKPGDALVVAKAAAAMAPQSDFVAQALGSAEEANGHRVEALQAYGRAMSLAATPRGFPGLLEAIRRLSDAAPKK